MEKEISISRFCELYELPRSFGTRILSMPESRLPGWIVIRGRQRRIDLAKIGAGSRARRLQAPAKNQAHR